MNRSSIFLPLAMLAIIGCTGGTAVNESLAPVSTTTTTTQSDGSTTTFVSLKVPNMV